ncbi:hypothetical protein M758_5G096700 [Ceratodon purpureus]|nr:hypothetical protein M758_5G096700 [Ceratodon purpureus]
MGVYTLKRYQKSYPGDEVVSQLVQQCEGTLLEVSSTNREVIDKSVCDPEEPKSTSSGPGRDLSNVADGAVCNSEVSPSFPDVGAKILALAAKLGSKAVAQRSIPVLGSTPTSGQDNGSAEKPVDSLGNWLNGDASDKGSPGV